MLQLKLKMNLHFQQYELADVARVTVGADSSSVIVKTPVASLIVAFDALDKSWLLFHHVHKLYLVKL